MKIVSRHLMGPGPSDVPASTLQALAQPTIGHLDPQFCDLMDAVKQLQRDVFLTRSPHSYTISAPASSAMEAAMANLLEPGDKIVVCVNGVFGGRLAEMARRQGAQVDVLEAPWGQPVDVNKLEQRLTSEKPKVVAFVHAETSTGVRSDAKAIGQLASRHGVISVADCVTSLGGVELRMDDWELDVIYSGSQKCLSCVPGIAPLMFSERAWDVIQSRTTRPTTWFGDLELLAGYWSGEGRRAYHHTAPVNAMYAWHHSLQNLAEEGLEASWQRHTMHSKAMKAGLEAISLTMQNPESFALPQLTVVRIPSGVDDMRVRSALLQDHHLEIGAGLGEFAGKVWRIGLMGHSARKESVERAISGLADVLEKPLEPALDAVRDCYGRLGEAA